MEKDMMLSLLEEIHESEAVQIENRLITFRINYFVFHRNYEELKKVLAGANENPEVMMKIWSLENRDQLDRLSNEITRLLLNFLASAKALVSQTRVLMKHWYKDTDFFTEYQNRVNDIFVENEMVSFIEKLRNYSLHYALPFATASFRAYSSNNEPDKIDKLDYSFSLNKEGLLFWKEWRNKSRKFLSKADDEILIEKVSDEYFTLVNGFHLWISNRLQEIHVSEFEWLAKMRKQVRGMMSDEEKKMRGIPLDD